jgi:hypothetical protein
LAVRFEAEFRLGDGEVAWGQLWGNSIINRQSSPVIRFLSADQLSGTTAHGHPRDFGSLNPGQGACGISAARLDGFAGFDLRDGAAGMVAIVLVVADA